MLHTNYAFFDVVHGPGIMKYYVNKYIRKMKATNFVTEFIQNNILQYNQVFLANNIKSNHHIFVFESHSPNNIQIHSTQNKRTVLTISSSTVGWVPLSQPVAQVLQ